MASIKGDAGAEPRPYVVYLYRYASKGNAGLTVLARTPEAADAVAEAYGRGLKHPYRRRRFCRVRAVRVSVPPMELEAEQLRVAERRALGRTNGEERK